MTREQARHVLAQLPKEDLNKIKQAIIALEIKRHAKEAAANQQHNSACSLLSQATTSAARSYAGKLSPKH